MRALCEQRHSAGRSSRLQSYPRHTLADLSDILSRPHVRADLGRALASTDAALIAEINEAFMEKWSETHFCSKGDRPLHACACLFKESYSA